ncbi:hypothetical protein CA13_18110 [Planctomycetes bacterium CA13]|uniref:PrcB C-terminal domain-containing protein n=1 Tax=Novipirellula herctigrandis TaxID=2527986 RepID=A0A5C5YZ95_9BACT|nr:hypothetical protein CA13_18110 [Planctomycetes bacterium CA13]
MKQYALCLLVAVCASFTNGCSQRKSVDLPNAKAERLEVLRTINVSRVETKGVYLVRSDEDLQQLTGDTVPEDVDFSTELVVIVACGECNTTGHSVEIQGMALQGDALQVFPSLSWPKGDRPVGMAITFPTHAVVIQKLAKSVNVEAVWLND